MNDIQTACGVLLVLCLIEAVALTLVRYGGFSKVVIASLIYACLVVPLLYVSMRYKGSGVIVVNFIWNIFSTLIMFFIGFYFFNETVDNLQILGAMISLLGLGLIIIS